MDKPESGEKRALIDKLKAMAISPSCCPELQKATLSYLSAVAFEQVAVKSFLASLNEAVDMSHQTLIEKVKDMAVTPTCCPVLRQAAKTYLSALTAEKNAAKNLLKEIEADISDINHLVAFSHSDRAVEKFGAERAKIFAANADALKASGAKFCNCFACTTAREILAEKNVLLE